MKKTLCKFTSKYNVFFSQKSSDSVCKFEEPQVDGSPTQDVLRGVDYKNQGKIDFEEWRQSRRAAWPAGTLKVGS